MDVALKTRRKGGALLEQVIMQHIYWNMGHNTIEYYWIASKSINQMLLKCIQFLNAQILMTDMARVDILTPRFASATLRSVTLPPNMGFGGFGINFGLIWHEYEDIFGELIICCCVRHGRQWLVFALTAVSVPHFHLRLGNYSQQM